MNLSQKPNTSAQPRTEHAPCTSYQRLIASGDSSLEPHFTELSNPGALGYDCPGLQRDTALPCTLSRN